MAIVRVRPRLCLVVCAAPPARDVPDVVPAAQAQGWDVSVVTTPLAHALFDVRRVEAQSGMPVRTGHVCTDPGDAPVAHVLLVAPATFTTLNKVAVGIADTLATRVLAEAIAAGRPVVAAPAVLPPLSAHPVYVQTLQRLRGWGVTVVERPDTGEDPHRFPWRSALRAVATHLTEPPRHGRPPGRPITPGT